MQGMSGVELLMWSVGAAIAWPVVLFVLGGIWGWFSVEFLGDMKVRDND